MFIFINALESCSDPERLVKHTFLFTKYYYKWMGDLLRGQMDRARVGKRGYSTCQDMEVLCANVLSTCTAKQFDSNLNMKTSAKT